jgi:hypothetical protein
VQEHRTVFPQTPVDERPSNVLRRHKGSVASNELAPWSWAKRIAHIHLSNSELPCWAEAVICIGSSSALAQSVRVSDSDMQGD